MAEDLTDYLQQHGVRVRYLHSEIDAIERVEIIRGLRLGEFDVLVGINLLREGLDLPEVSLVAILDADQEGFLRSDRSLIQTGGRAARHLQARAVLYADRVTGSMQRALDEMSRRRQAQVAYNAEHGITPRSIVKSVDQVRFATRFADAKTVRPVEGGVPRPADAKERDALIKLLESQMQAAAEELDFELAALLRDQILDLRAEADIGRHEPVRGRAPAVRVGARARPRLRGGHRALRRARHRQNAAGPGDLRGPGRPGPRHQPHLRPRASLRDIRRTSGLPRGLLPAQNARRGARPGVRRHGAGRSRRADRVARAGGSGGAAARSALPPDVR